MLQDRIAPPAAPERPRRGPLLRLLWLMLGLLSVALGVIGIWLPGLPTTPFLLLAAACFARSNDRLHDWLVQHRTFGPMIRNWRDHRAISRRAKRLSLATMFAALALSFWMAIPPWALLLQAMALAGAASFILSRPEGPKD